MKKGHSFKIITLAGIIFILAFVLCACNLFQSVDEAEDFNKGSLKDAYVSIEINCKTILEGNNISKLPSNKKQYVPDDGIILKKENVQLRKDDSAFTVLMRLCKEKNILVTHEYNPMYGSEYIVGINNLNEMDCGSSSGWTFWVNNEYPNYGVDKYILKDGDNILFRYVCSYQ